MVIFAIIACIGILFALFTLGIIPSSSLKVNTHESVPDYQKLNNTSDHLVNENRSGQSHLEIYVPDTNTTYRIFPDQPEYDPLLENLTVILQSLKYQAKCSPPYDEFQATKDGYRYISFVSQDIVSARYCYNNESARCRNIPTNDVTILLKKTAGNDTNTECADTGSIVTYRNGVDGGIWSLSENDAFLLNNLTKNVQEIIGQ
ncbi:MAG: hypothetical protein WC342_06725 [Methanoregula sp.]